MCLFVLFFLFFFFLHLFINSFKYILQSGSLLIFLRIPLIIFSFLAEHVRERRREETAFRSLFEYGLFQIAGTFKVSYLYSSTRIVNPPSHVSIMSFFSFSLSFALTSCFLRRYSFWFYNLARLLKYVHFTGEEGK